MELLAIEALAVVLAATAAAVPLVVIAKATPNATITPTIGTTIAAIVPPDNPLLFPLNVG